MVKSSRTLPADSLVWKSLPASVSSLDASGGMMMFEEADGVDVRWEEDGKGGKKAVLVVSWESA